MSTPLTLTIESLVPLHNPSDPSLASQASSITAVQYPQTKHRIDIVEAWGGSAFFAGGTVLELGCGQGDMSVVLAGAVAGAEGGKVVAWDPARGDYGSPMTLAQAQSHLASQPALSHLEFYLTTPLASLLSPSASRKYTHAVLAHSIYYFPSPSTLLDTLNDLHSHSPPIEHLCLAEYALQASKMEQVPHVQAVLAQSSWESIRPPGPDAESSNVRTVLSPTKILEIAKQAGWELDLDEAGQPQQRIITPDAPLQDGSWEVGTVLSSRWMENIKSADLGESAERQMAWIEAMRDAVRSSVGLVKTSGGKTQTMDVFCAVFRRV